MRPARNYRLSCRLLGFTWAIQVHRPQKPRQKWLRVNSPTRGMYWYRLPWWWGQWDVMLVVYRNHKWWVLKLGLPWPRFWITDLRGHA